MMLWLGHRILLESKLDECSYFTIRGSASSLSFLVQGLLASVNAYGGITATVDQQPYTQGFQSVMGIALYLKYGLTPANINTSNRALIDKTNVDQVVNLVGGANAIRGG